MNQLIRLAACSFSVNGISTFNEFAARVQRNIRFAADTGALVVVFPEYVTSPLLALNADWDHWTAQYIELFSDLARQFKIGILAGTHLAKEEKGNQHLVNRAFFFKKEGGYSCQDKWHLTPWESKAYPLKPGSKIELIDLGVCKVGVAICYDVEFPEYLRSMVRAGADLVLVPSCTDDMQGFWRVRHCIQARCVENSIAIVHAPLIGELANVVGFEQNLGSAAILVPCDHGFAQQGIAAIGPFNEDICIISEVDILKLRQNRQLGSVRPFLDLRKDYP